MRIDYRRTPVDKAAELTQARHGARAVEVSLERYKKARTPEGREFWQRVANVCGGRDEMEPVLRFADERPAQEERAFEPTRASEDVAVGNEVPRMSEAELRAFVLEYVKDKVFTSDHIRLHDANLLPLIFMPIALGAFRGWSDAELSEIGILYATFGENRHVGRSINGYPQFVECRMMHKDDWKRAREAILREKERLQSIQV